MVISIVTTRDDVEALMAVASAFHAGEKTRPASQTRLPDGRYDWFASPSDALRFLDAARRYAETAHGARFELPRSAPTTAQLGRLRKLRDAVQALIDGDRRRYERAAGALLGHYAFRLDAAGELRAVDGGWDRFIADRLPALIAARTSADRLRLCANPECRWALWDTTKGGTRVWCDSRTCGNKMKVRAFRARERRQRHTRSR